MAEKKQEGSKPVRDYSYLAEPKRRKGETAQAMKDFLRVYAEVGDIIKASRIVGVSHKTIYNWRATEPEFNAKFLHIQSVLIQKLENLAFRIAMEGDSKMIMFLLERRYADTYGRQIKMEAKVKETQSIEFRVAGRDRTEAAIELAQRVLALAADARDQEAGAAGMEDGSGRVIDSEAVGIERLPVHPPVSDESAHSDEG